MKIFKTISKSILFLFICFVTFSCGSGDQLVPLKSVVIPEYDKTDYIKLLDNTNPEIVYNAICNLIDDGGDFSKILSSDSIEDPAMVEEARTVYNKISDLLLSDDEWIVCSSLAFIGNFAGEYKDKDEIAQKLLKVKLKTKSIKLEYINTLQSLYGANTEPFKKILSDYLTSDSWLISRYTYKIIPYLDEKQFMSFLVSKYSKADEYDKLLLIGSIGELYNDTLLSFIIDKLKTEKNPKVKSILFKQLGNAENQNKVIDWLNGNRTILKDINNSGIEYYIENIEKPTGSAIVSLLMRDNLISDSLIYGSNSNFYTKFSSVLSNDTLKNEAVLKNIKTIESMILNNENYKRNWFKYRMEFENPQYSDAFIQKQKALINEFKQKSAKIYDEYKLDQKYKTKYIEKIQGMESEFEKQNN